MTRAAGGLGADPERAIRIMLIGPMPSRAKNAHEAIGGANVRFAEIARELGARGFAIDVVNTARGIQALPRRKRAARAAAALARTLWAVATRARRSDVVFICASPYSGLTAAALARCVCAVLRRPMAALFFGGSLAETYRRYPRWRRRLMDRTCLAAPLVYAQTRQLLREFQDRPNFRLLPNTRDIPAPPRRRCAARPHGEKLQLIFLSQLRMEKGLAEALAACGDLSESCVLNVFGPPMSNTDFSLFDNHPNASYRGTLDPSEVPARLREHDALIFPSYHRGEGYPGVIIEAFQCGLPVIAARWMGVPDLFEGEDAGLLVEPRSADDLRSAIKRLIDDPALRSRLAAGAKRQGEKFRSGPYFDGVAAELRQLAAYGNRRDRGRVKNTRRP